MMKVYLEDDWIRAVYYDRMRTVLQSHQVAIIAWSKGPLLVLEYAESPGVIPRIIAEVRDIQLTLAPWPDYDIQYGTLDQFGKQFDVIIADQVLEHVPDIFAAMRTCVLLCKTGGVLVFGTPWQYPYHPAPRDYWRISRDAYQMMFDQWGVETVEIGGWGHKEALIFGHQTDGFLTVNRTVQMAEEAGLFDIENDPDHAIQVWAIGRKR